MVGIDGIPGTVGILGGIIHGFTTILFSVRLDLLLIIGIVTITAISVRVITDRDTTPRSMMISGNRV